MTKNKQGRPTSTDPKSTIVNFRLSQDEVDKMNYMMAKAGITNKTAFVKKALFSKEIKVVKTSLATERYIFNLTKAVSCYERMIEKLTAFLDKAMISKDVDNKTFLASLDLLNKLGDRIYEMKAIADKYQTEISHDM